MHIIIDDEYRMEYQTDLRPVIHAIREYIEGLDWLISYHEFWYLEKETYDERLNPHEKLIRISGKELCEVVDNSPMQFVWGVLSGSRSLPGLESLDLERLDLKNYGAEAYVYEDAEVEIDCFDSTFTTIRSKNEAILKKIADYIDKPINVS
jgi:hypothetical protein